MKVKDTRLRVFSQEGFLLLLPNSLVFRACSLAPSIFPVGLKKRFTKVWVCFCTIVHPPLTHFALKKERKKQKCQRRQEGDRVQCLGNGSGSHGQGNASTVHVFEDPQSKPPLHCTSAENFRENAVQKALRQNNDSSC